MKITNFSPLIISPNYEEVMAVFEALGFEKQHLKTNVEGGRNDSVTMKNENGDYVTVAKGLEHQNDLTSIRINVDDFNEAYQFFMNHGFTDSRGGTVTTTRSSLDTLLISPSGFTVTISQHTKSE